MPRPRKFPSDQGTQLIPVKIGRPLGSGKFKESYPEELLGYMEQGMLDCEIYAAWRISKETFYVWLRERPELKTAYDQGISLCEAWWVGKMRECFLNHDDKGFKYCIAIMNNKFGWEKGSKQSDQTTNNITINNMNVLQNKSRDGLLDYIKKSFKKHEDIIDAELIEDQSKSVE